MRNNIINFFNVSLIQLYDFFWRNILPAIIPIIVLIETSIEPILRIRRKINQNTDKYIIIIGANFDNKGAQAMLFTVVDQIRKKFPNKIIFVFSPRDFEKNINKKRKHKFEIIPWNKELRMIFLSFWYKYFIRDYKYDYLEKKIKNIIQNAESIIDISGYRLTSQMGAYWIFYLADILIAKKYSVKYFIFPQSIGPFDFPLRNRIFFYPLARKCLKYPEKIFVRENDGIRYVRQFRKKNTEKSFDIVLQNNAYNLSNIYEEKLNFKNIQILPNSVCIIPNKRVIERAKSKEIFLIYYLIIKRLLKANKNIYILSHSIEDLKICKEIKNFFPKIKNVNLIIDELNIIEIEKIIKKFDFLIASRYHSIILGYKNGIPAIAIGWAVKYFELLKSFGQSDYFFDIRNIINVKEIIKKLERMINNYKNEKIKLITYLNYVLSKKKCFDVL